MVGTIKYTAFGTYWSYQVQYCKVLGALGHQGI